MAVFQWYLKREASDLPWPNYPCGLAGLSASVSIASIRQATDMACGASDPVFFQLLNWVDQSSIGLRLWSNSKFL